MRNCKRKKENIILFHIVAGLFLAVLIYTAGCFPFYVHQKSSMMENVYQEVQEMDLEDLNEEDQETLDNYQKEKLKICIINEKLEVVYSSRSAFVVPFVKKQISDKSNQYTEEGSIDWRGYRLRNILALKGKIIQDNQNFYVYIRKDLQSGHEIVSMTVIYMILVLLIICGVIFWLLRRKEKNSQNEVKQADFQLLESQREFVANISHELKTPLAVVSGQVEMLELMGEKADKDYYYSSIHEELDKMSKMIGELLDFSMLDNQLENMQTGVVNVSEMTDYLLMKYEALFRKNQIRLEKEIQPKCLVVGNQMYLERAVNNYLMNAFQHTSQGQCIRVSVKENKRKIRIEVYNDGIPIEKDQMSLIWNSFYTFSRKKQQKNTDAELKNIGIGLYVVKKIIQQHKGSCGAENLSEGVRFWIELPAYNRKGENQNEE